MAEYINIANEGGNPIVNDSFKNVSFVGKFPMTNYISRQYFQNNPKWSAGFIMNPQDEQTICVISSSGSGQWLYEGGYLPIYHDAAKGDLKGNEFCGTMVKGNVRDTLYQVAKDYNYYLFRYQTSDRGPGVDVINSNGEHIFNSQLHYLRVIDVITSPGTKSYSHNIGFIPCNGHQVPDGGYNTQRFCIPTPNSITCEWDDKGGFYGLVVNLDGIF